jgi:glucosamine--fructose-6-phosphate aminotransferase (isomerizing)
MLRETYWAGKLAFAKWSCFGIAHPPENPMTSLMLHEARQCPALVRAALDQDGDLYDALGRALRGRAPDFVATVARGSSDHAASYAASLFGLLAGRVTASLPPSLITRYGATLHLANAVALAISQSGASPDLVQVMAAAGAAGAMRIAIVNTPDSKLAAQADWVLPQRAGPERAIAATKSFVLTLVSVARLVAAWTGDGPLAAALPHLPGRLESALTCDWSLGLPILSAASQGAYVVGRGPGMAVAGEAALKLKETANLHAEAVSAIEIQHGPRALADAGFPVLAFALDDAGGDDTRALAAELSGLGVPVCVAASTPAGVGVHLPLPPPLHPLLDPIAAILAFYPFVEALSRQRGLDPDRPRGLRKVTETV